MASTLEKIKTLLSTKEESKETKLYAEAVLDDGRILATEDDKMQVGSVVFVVGEDGETEAVAEGEYTLEDGTKIIIGSDSAITQIGEEEVEEETEETEEEDDSEDLGKRYKEMESRVKELEKAVFGDKEEMKEEAPVEEKVEMSKDMINSLVEEVEHLKSQIVELEKQPGAEGFKHNPETTTRKERPNLAKMSTKDRVAFFINNK